MVALTLWDMGLNPETCGYQQGIWRRTWSRRQRRSVCHKRSVPAHHAAPVVAYRLPAHELTEVLLVGLFLQKERWTGLSSPRATNSSAGAANCCFGRLMEEAIRTVQRRNATAGTGQCGV